MHGPDCHRLVPLVGMLLIESSINILGTDSQQPQTVGPPPPLFSYQEINVSAGIAGLASFIQINQNVKRSFFYCILTKIATPRNAKKI